MVRRVFAVVWVAAWALLGPACASPTLPLPPPSVPTIGPGPMAGQVHLSAQCGGTQAGATVLVINDAQPTTKRDGVTVSDSCGAWALDVYASSHDILQIQQIVGSEISDVVSVQVP